MKKTKNPNSGDRFGYVIKTVKQELLLGGHKFIDEICGDGHILYNDYETRCRESFSALVENQGGERFVIFPTRQTNNICPRCVLSYKRASAYADWVSGVNEFEKAQDALKEKPNLPKAKGAKNVKRVNQNTGKTGATGAKRKSNPVPNTHAKPTGRRSQAPKKGNAAKAKKRVSPNKGR